MEGDGMASVANNTEPHNNYQYNGKELQPETGWNDYGARMYDASIGRWMVVDPLADDPFQVSQTPYGFTLNSPVALVDNDGKCVVCASKMSAVQINYTVLSGEGVYTIAKKFAGVEMKDIALLNKDKFKNSPSVDASDKVWYDYFANGKGSDWNINEDDNLKVGIFIPIQDLHEDLVENETFGEFMEKNKDAKQGDIIGNGETVEVVGAEKGTMMMVVTEELLPWATRMGAKDRTYKSLSLFLQQVLQEYHDYDD
jgi:RHS repeat-associated protein